MIYYHHSPKRKLAKLSDQFPWYLVTEPKDKPSAPNTKNTL